MRRAFGVSILEHRRYEDILDVENVETIAIVMRTNRVPVEGKFISVCVMCLKL